MTPAPKVKLTEAEIEAQVGWMCERCQGNGEIVTDWNRYLHPRRGDIGDEAVKECPDCSGYGRRDLADAIERGEHLAKPLPNSGGESL